VSWDKQNDVLYIKEEGARIMNSRESDDDNMVILNFTREGKLAGTQILYASEFMEKPDAVENLPLPPHYIEAICPHLKLDFADLMVLGDN
jgi:uncharacterized protein YuzE